MAVCGAVANHIQVCYDVLGRDTGGFTLRFYVNSVSWGWDDDQYLEIRGSNGTSVDHHYHASSPDGTSVTMTTVDVGFPVGTACANFQAFVRDVAGGGAPGVGGTECGESPPPTGTVPNAPNVAVNLTTTTSIHGISSSAGDNGSPIDQINYRLVRQVDNAYYGEIRGGYEGVWFENLPKGTTFWLDAQAHNAYGWSAWSPRVYTLTQSDVPTTAVPAATDITATTARAYTAVPAVSNGSTIDYVIYRLHQTSNYAISFDSPPALYDPGFIFSGLSPNTSYDLFVNVHNGVGFSGWSYPPVRFSTLPSIPGAPTITSVTSITPTSAVVSWSPPTDTGGQTITAYDVEYSSDNWATKVTQATGTLTGLTPGVTYQVRVRAKNASGPGPYSNVWSFTTVTGIKVYNGAAFVDAPVYAWNGTAFVACEVRIWNGSAWVPTG